MLLLCCFAGVFSQTLLQACVWFFLAVLRSNGSSSTSPSSSSRQVFQLELFGLCA